MKLETIHFEPIVYIKFTKDDADHLTACSKNHYDARCREALRPGGIIYGINNSVEYMDGLYGWSIWFKPKQNRLAT